MAKRRSKGDGGLYQRHDHPSCPPIDERTGNRESHRCIGRWVGNVEIHVDGQRRRKTVYGRTKKEAQTKLNTALRERDSGTLVLSSTTVASWLTYWLEHIAARDLKPQTLRGYRSKIDSYLIPQLGRHRLTDLRADHIRRLHDWMREKGLAEASVRQAHAILKKSLRDAVYEGRLAVSPADRVKSPKTTKARRTPLSVEQAKGVLAQAGDNPRWWLALFCGMRQGECLGLRWRDVDFDKHTITITQTLQIDADYRISFGTPKSGASARILPLLPWVAARLKLHYLNSGRPDPDGLVFTHNGKPVWPNADWDAWHDLLIEAEVPHVALHAARNSTMSLLEEAGVPDRLVMQMMGHSQVQVTHNYQSADAARMTKAYEALGELLGLPTTPPLSAPDTPSTP